MDIADKILVLLGCSCTFTVEAMAAIQNPVLVSNLVFFFHQVTFSLFLKDTGKVHFVSTVACLCGTEFRTGPFLSGFSIKIFFGCLPRMISLSQLFEMHILVTLIVVYYKKCAYILSVQLLTVQNLSSYHCGKQFPTRILAGKRIYSRHGEI